MTNLKPVEQARIGIVGLGYVGLPLAVEFGKIMPTVGFDIKAHRVEELRQGRDSTLETTDKELTDAKHLSYTDNISELRDCNVFIVTVPTPIDKYKRPDLTPIYKATEAVAGIIKPGDVIIYESTVYPGVTDDECVPILEKHSGLKFNQDFFLGYSPERINPGDKEHRLTTIVKVTAGSTDEAAEFVDQLYRKIITAGTHKASSIKVAEAAKVIENTQRDINIALINELSLIFNRIGIDTLEVLEAAGTKWNFLPFRPGLVGGHCIGVDPYYLTHKAQSLGYHPEVILAGRRINDGMGQFVADNTIKLLAQNNKPVAGANVLILGLTFKENCPDIRNTRVIDIIQALELYNINISIHDPMASNEEVKAEYGVDLVNDLKPNYFDAIIIAVNHQQYVDMGIDKIKALGSKDCVIYDIKSVFPSHTTSGRL